MPVLSSTTLFNFTDSLDYLIDNLKQGFYCHNSYEKLPLKNNGYKVPMACFCDIPLSLIKEHFDWYGRYGIGIKRSYARLHGVKPVWYITSESKLVKDLLKSKEVSERERKYLLPYLKQFMGNQEHPKAGKPKRKKFYDEREWRYLPDDNLVQPMFKVDKESVKGGEEQNSLRMQLDLNSIEYIIIEKEQDFKRMLVELKTLSTERGIEYESLVSKILTAKQIERDF